MNSAKYMRGDTLVSTAGGGDLSPLVGTWTNTDTDTNHFMKVITSLAPDGAFSVRMFGVDDDALIDWGEADGTPFVTSATLQGVGFHARYDFGDAETLIAANQSKGVLVIQAYTMFKDGSGRPNYFSREFFHQ
ncbi:MAG: hypothetical protein JWQ98_3381 [Chlorobi bacterium]|nr:hypothetical protein [Chlorobiota bacterium]